MKMYRSPNGDEIIGTAEKVSATALIIGIADDGTPVYEGSSDLHWDTQVTQQRDGKILYVCDSGDEWTFDQLVPVEAEEEEAA